MSDDDEDLLRMFSAGLKQSSQKNPKTFPRSLFVPLLCVFIVIIIIFKLSNNDMSTKMKMIYPKMKTIAKSPNKPEHNDFLSRDKPSSAAPLLKVCDVPVQSGPMFQVGDHKTYVTGSYVEHRNGGGKVKTIAIVHRSYSDTLLYNCLFCCNGKNVSVPAVCEVHSDHFNFEYGTADIVCRIPEECTTKLYVTVTATSHERSGSWQNIESFQLVGNPEPKEKFPFKFTVCISVMYDWINVLELVEAMEMFKILGVQRVVVYKTNCSSETQKILDYYVKKDFVEIIPWTVASKIQVSRGWRKWASPGQLHYFGQIAALNDCIYRYMYQTEYVALQDLDELILPIKVMTWTELLHQVKQQYPYSAGFEFENHLFPLSVKQQKRKFETDSWKNVPGVNILEFVQRIRNDPNKFNNFKVIVNPRLVYKATVHGLLVSDGSTFRVDPNIARMYHMRHVDSFNKTLLIDDTRVWDYAHMLIPSVSEVLQQVLNIQ
ncbi:uncharacterized protein LOC143491088 [Brachyhypopomus gauderio]|uniref:uncharacterized protein LOC143491088 n=1 Tax=Brachyhypopomus gauderio TaxID=698409 RepID=UPI004041AD3F